jgi:hypothetical protein
VLWNLFAEFCPDRATAGGFPVVRPGRGRGTASGELLRQSSGCTGQAAPRECRSDVCQTSQPEEFVASSFSGASNLPVNQTFQWKAEPANNNTANPGATLNLLYGLGAAKVAETGLRIGPKGIIGFAAGQTFPGTGPGSVKSVGLSAPTSDFIVNASPVTSSGTLALSWNVAPTNSDTSNAIVKRDVNGSFTAGAITANLGLEGITGSSSGSGVAGVNYGGGIGVYGTGSTGVFGTGSSYGFVTDSNVQQARTAGGWAKAMVFVNGAVPPYKILSCYNSTLAGAAASTPPCGFDLEELFQGFYTIDFGFQVDDRFMSSTLSEAVTSDSVQFATATSRILPTVPNNHTVAVYCTDSGDNPVLFDFYLIVF